MKMENLRFLFIILGAIFAILAIVSGFFANYFDKKIKEKEKQKTTLVGNLAATATPHINDYFTVLLGHETISYHLDSIRKNDTINPIYRFFGIKFPFVITFKDKPLISTTLRSFDNKIVASLANNEWEVNPNNYFDRNFDKSTFEVIDQYNIPILRVEYIDSLTILLAGVFLHGKTLLILTDEVSNLSRGIFSLEMIIEKCKDLKRVFNYPSSTHLGERVFEGSDYVKSLRNPENKERKKINDKELIEKSEKVYQWVLKNSEAKHYNDPKIDMVEWEKTLNEYYSVYKSDALYYRSELYKRSEIEKPKGRIDLMYENPVNEFAMKDVANDLRYILDEFKRGRK